MKRLSIVLPCYNPPEGWDQHVLKSYHAICDELSFSPEIILVNDGSAQEIKASVIESLTSSIQDFRYIGYTENKGKGYALRYGVMHATAEFIIYTDIDFPYTTDSIIDIWVMLNDGCDIVAGVKDKAYYKNIPKTRIRISRILRSMIGFFFSMPITDTQCGLKGFNQKGKMVFLSTTINKYLCDLEFIYKGFRTIPKLNIQSQPVQLRAGIVFRKMNWQILSIESLNFLKIFFSRRNQI